MLWMSRPPYVRWTFIGALLLVSLWLEIRPTPTVSHPYLTRDLARGAPVEEALEWRKISKGVLDPVPGTGFANRRLVEGQPLLKGDTVESGLQVPPGWWLLDLPLPSETAPGTRVQLVVLPDAGNQPVPPIGGIVTDVRPSEYAGDGPVGSVAFPPDLAATAAVAIAEDRISVLVDASGVPASD